MSRKLGIRSARILAFIPLCSLLLTLAVGCDDAASKSGPKAEQPADISKANNNMENFNKTAKKK